MKTAVTIICQCNPTSSSSAVGIGTLIRSYIAHALSDFEFKVVGVSDDQSVYPTFKWHPLKIEDKCVPFLPIIFDDGQPKVLPLSIRFTYALFRYRHRLDCSGRILHFHRPEPVVVHERSWSVHDPSNLSQVLESAFQSHYKLPINSLQHS